MLHKFLAIKLSELLHHLHRTFILFIILFFIFFFFISGYCAFHLIHTIHSTQTQPLHKMTGSHESNPDIEIATAFKKSKSGKTGHHKSGKSGQVHEHSGQSGNNMNNLGILRKRARRGSTSAKSPPPSDKELRMIPQYTRMDLLKLFLQHLRRPTSPMDCMLI